MEHATQNRVSEWSYSSVKAYADPFRDVELDVVFTGPDGDDRRVPAFWAGKNVWRARYASPELGRHTYRTECSDVDNRALHGLAGELEVHPYEGDNPLLQHGPLRVAAGRRHLEHHDGSPFFWLGDTWWWGLVGDFVWPEEFQELVADRVQKGFNLIQIVAGHVPAMPEGDARAGNEGGLPWSADYGAINPAYFDLADARIDCLVDNGLVPCVVGMWGYWLERLGVENVKRHWRYLIARYGAYPVVWCLCGEVQCIYPDFLPENADPEPVRRDLKELWSEVCRHVGRTDPYARPLTAHPDDGSESRDMLDDDVPLTVCMLQTGHSFHTLPGMLEMVSRARSRQPHMPVVNGECVYESILGSSWQDVQRFALWSCVLAGAAGHTYGAAEGCWQIHHRGRGPFPFTSGVWGEYEEWRDIAALPGSGQMQWCRRLMERFAWWQFEPQPMWLDLRVSSDRSGNCFVPRAAGIPGVCRVVYLPPPSYAEAQLEAVVGLESGVSYRAHWYDPRCGARHELAPVAPEDGRWTPPCAPSMQDWVIVLETGCSAVSVA